MSKAQSIVSFPSDYVVVDLETTGYSTEWDHIIECSCLRVCGDEISERYSTLIRLDERLDPFIVELTGITDKMLAGAPAIEAVLPDIREFIGNSPLVGHNVSFDYNFLAAAFGRYLSTNFDNSRIDTMRLFRKLYPELEHHRLEDMCAVYGVSSNGHHRAEADCVMTYNCLKHIKADAAEKYGSLSAFEAAFRQKSHSGKLDARGIVSQNDCFDETHPLFGKICVFTGTLDRMDRRTAMQLVADHGGICGNGVTAKTNFLILGNNDYCSSIKDGKSTKHKKAEELILKGKDLVILPEGAFYDMIDE